jgi:tetratricopeptide (TPR) repeat protein
MKKIQLGFSLMLLLAIPGCADLVTDGNKYFSNGDYDGAIADYTKAIELKPDNAVAYYDRGIVKGKKGDYGGAIADYTKAIELKPDFARAYGNRSGMKAMEGDYDGAIADCTKAIELKPDDAHSCFIAYYERGWAEYYKKDFESAILDATRAIELDSKSGPAYGSRGWARYGKGDVAGALEDCKKAVELIGVNWEAAACSHQGLIDFITGNYGKAVESWQKAIQKDASNQRELQPWIEKAKAKQSAPK